jgi:hypothetical protein
LCSGPLFSVINGQFSRENWQGSFMSWIRLKGLCRERVLKSNQYLCAEFRIRIQLGQWIRIQEGKNDPL